MFLFFHPTLVNKGIFFLYSPDEKTKGKGHVQRLHLRRNPAVITANDLRMGHCV